jgi:crotonobetaine/carnitine-CoA ligase
MKTSMDYPGLVPTVPGFDYVTIPALLKQRAEEHPDQDYIIFEGKNNTISDIYKKANRLANGLIDLGVKKGEIVMIMLPNTDEHVAAFFGIVSSGAIELPVNNAFRDKELKYIIEHSEATTVITDPDHLPHILDVWELTGGRKILCMGKTDVEGVIDYDEFVGKYPETQPEVEMDIDDPATMIYTSGSTAFPKGVLISHRYKVLYGALSNWSYRLGKKDRIMLITPIFHGVALWHGIMGCLHGCIPCTVIRYFSATKFWDMARECKATFVFAIGAIPAMLMNHPEQPNDKDHDVRVIWAFMTPKRIMEPFEERFNTTIYDGLGQTENGRLLVNYPPLRKPGALGLPYEFTEIKIVDDEDNTLSQGEIGEICARAPTMLLGYYKNPEATADTLKGGWLHTGDNGYMDEDGIYWFTDRKKDIIRRRGKVISSFEVQDAITLHEAIAEVACVAVESDLAEEEILACIILKEGAKAPEFEELAKLCKDNISYYKVPRYWVYVDSFPKTPTFRIQKFILRKSINMDEVIEIPVTKPDQEIKRVEK